MVADSVNQQPANSYQSEKKLPLEGQRLSRGHRSRDAKTNGFDRAFNDWFCFFFFSRWLGFVLEYFYFVWDYSVAEIEVIEAVVILNLIQNL